MGCSKCPKTNSTAEQAESTTKQPVKTESAAKTFVNNLKSSIFCGTKGFLTFSLAFLSYLEYDTHRNTKLKESAAFAMKRNTIPFFEMAIITPFVCFALPAMVASVNLIQCALVCAALMITTCFVVRTCQLREKLLEKITKHSRKEIDAEFKKDTIKFPIFDKNRKHIEYNSPNQVGEAGNTSFLVAFLVFPLKVLQSCIMLSLTAIELLEAVSSFCTDLIFDRSFSSTQSNLKRSSHLLYASVRNLVPISILDKPVAELIGTPKATCCSAKVRKAVILLNLGGPDSLSAVRPFLFNLFYDKRIINLPNPLRFLLAKLISAKRENTAQKIYEQIGGKSPILESTKAQADVLELRLNNEDRNYVYKVFTCMRYWHPFADEVVKSVKQFDPNEVILLPLYPQYSTTTTLSSIENWQKNAKKYGLECNARIICHYHNSQDFVESHAHSIVKYYKLASRIGKPRVLFSAHSLPLSVIKKGDPYALQVEGTVKLIVKKLNIKDLDWSMCYQSKIGPVKWLEPSTESELLRAKADGVPVVLSPISFVSEHSETLVELDIKYKAMIKDGYYFRVPTLGTDFLFIKCLVNLCINHL